MRLVVDTKHRRASGRQMHVAGAVLQHCLKKQLGADGVGAVFLAVNAPNLGHGHGFGELGKQVRGTRLGFTGGRSHADNPRAVLFRRRNPLAVALQESVQGLAVNGVRIAFHGIRLEGAVESLPAGFDLHPGV